MIPHDVDNDEVIDYTRTLEFLAHYLMAPGCQVRLNPRQFEVLKVYLSHLQDIGEDVNYQLEMCIDYSGSTDSGGYSVSWDNDGTSEQDDFVDTIMEDMIQNLGFYAGSIIREGHITNLEDIDDRIAEIRARVTARHNT